MKLKSSTALFLDLLFITRPLLLVPVWGFAAFGYWRCKGFSIADVPRSLFLIRPEVLLWIIIFSLSVAAVYILNQIADIEVDLKNGGKPLIASGVVSPAISMVFAVFLSVVSIAVPLAFSRTTLALLSGLALLIGILYSFKPFSFSGRPFLDFFSNATGYGLIAFGAGWSLAGGELLNKGFLFSALPYFLLMCAGSISSTLPDRPGDLECGKNTTAVVLGNFKAHVIALICLISAGLFSFINPDSVVKICFIGTVPFYLGYLIGPNRFWMEATYKAGGAFTMICAGVLIPLMIPVALIVFLMTWLYFRLRHGVSYPTLVPVNSGT